MRGDKGLESCKVSWRSSTGGSVYLCPRMLLTYSITPKITLSGLGHFLGDLVVERRFYLKTLSRISRWSPSEESGFEGGVAISGFSCLYHFFPTLGTLGNVFDEI